MNEFCEFCECDPCDCDWGISSVGRAPDLHSGGQEFESLILHHFRRGDRAVEGARLERECAATYRGFESHPFRHFK